MIWTPISVQGYNNSTTVRYSSLFPAVARLARLLTKRSRQSDSSSQVPSFDLHIVHQVSTRLS